MPSVFLLTGVFAELGSGAANNEARASANVGKIFHDASGYLYVLRSNAEGTSRVAFAPTILDETNTATRGGVCIQPAANRLHMFDGVWRASVAASNTTDDTDIQHVLYRGSASAVPVQSGRSRAASGTLAFFVPNAAADNFASESAAMTSLADLHHLKYAIVVGGSVASTVENTNLLMHGLSPL